MFATIHTALQAALAMFHTAPRSPHTRIRTCDAGTAMLYSAPAGVAGDIEGQDADIEPIFMDDDNPVLTYGAAAKVNATGYAEAIEAGDAASVFGGILTRIAPGISGSDASGFTDGVPRVESAQGLMKKGRVKVVCSVGTPTRGGAVYMRNVAATGKLVGDLEATEDISATASAGAMAGTGNATAGSITAADGTTPGVYTVRMLTATTFEVTDPNHDLFGPGANGTPFVVGGLTFTITAGGTPAVAGDTIAITAVDASKNVLLANCTWALPGKDASKIALLRVNL